jgi:hypothetical protein
MTTFRRKQIGRASLSIAIFLIIWTAVFLSHSPLAALATMILTALIGFTFSSMTVEIDAREVRWWFAPRIIRGRIDRKDVVSAQPVSSGWWRGWGIRYVQGGWLFNVSGLQAVELRLRNGRRVLIGTDRPKEMVRALAAA